MSRPSAARSSEDFVLTRHPDPGAGVVRYTATLAGVVVYRGDLAEHLDAPDTGATILGYLVAQHAAQLARPRMRLM